MQSGVCLLLNQKHHKFVINIYFVCLPLPLVCTPSVPACHRWVHRNVSEAGAGAGPPATRWSLSHPGASACMYLCVCVCFQHWTKHFVIYSHLYILRVTGRATGTGQGVLALTFGRVWGTDGHSSERGGRGMHTHTHTRFCCRTAADVAGQHKRSPFIVSHTDDTLVKCVSPLWRDKTKAHTHLYTLTKNINSLKKHTHIPKQNTHKHTHTAQLLQSQLLP